MAQVFARLGASVVVFEVLDRVLPAEDRDVAERLQAMMEREGIGFRLGAAPTAIDGDGPVKVVVTESGERIAVDEIFVATGRAPATGGLALERAGISTRDGAVEVDSTLRTSNRRVWAAGDVIGGMQYTHVAEYHAKTVLRNALLPGAQRVDYTTVPRVTYTDPELAHVGLSEAEAGAAGGTTYSYELDDLDRAIVDAEARGVVKISADGRGRILGATILGSHAGELLMPLVIAKRHGLKLGRVAGTIFPYPTMAEGVKRASDAYMRSRLESPGGRVLRRVISWLK